MPGLVSTLLNHAYSMPSREVHTFLQVTEQVWHPMHLSRLSTIAICARTFIYAFSWTVSAADSAGWSSQSTFAILRTTTNSSRFEPTVP